MWRAGSQRGDCDNSKVRLKSVSGLVRAGGAGTAFKLRITRAEIEGSRTSKVSSWTIGRSRVHKIFSYVSLVYIYVA